MRRKNGQFISNAELIELLAKLKNNHKTALETIDSYQNKYDEISKRCDDIYKRYEHKTKEIIDLKEKLDTFSIVLRITEAYLLFIIGIPLLFVFVGHDMAGAIETLWKICNTYCFTCLAMSIIIISSYYGKEN